MKIWNNSEEDGEVDLTPMIDIVFLLIVFFMTVANMLTAEKKPIDMPVALNSTIPEEYGERTTVTVQRDGSLYAGVYSVTVSELGEILVDAFQQDPQVRVYLRADSGAEHQYVNDVLKACANAGLRNVIFAAFQSDK